MSGIVGGAGSKSGVIGTTELDYEEGTWTPIFLSSGGDIDSAYGITTVVNSATYVKIGKSVTLFYNGTGTYKATAGTAAFQCEGLPFTPSSAFTIAGPLCGAVQIAGGYPERATYNNTTNGGRIQTGGGNTFPAGGTGNTRTLYGWSNYVTSD